MDPDPAIFVIDLQDVYTKLIFFSVYYFLNVHLNYFSKMKSQKESQNSTVGINVFLTVLHDDRRIRSRILIRIHTSD